MESKKTYLIICEGASEYAYIQELNRYLNARRSRLVFVARNAGGGGGQVAAAVVPCDEDQGQWKDVHPGRPRHLFP